MNYYPALTPRLIGSGAPRIAADSRGKSASTLFRMQDLLHPMYGPVLTTCIWHRGILFILLAGVEFSHLVAREGSHDRILPPAAGFRRCRDILKQFSLIPGFLDRLMMTTCKTQATAATTTRVQHGQQRDAKLLITVKVLRPLKVHFDTSTI